MFLPREDETKKDIMSRNRGVWFDLTADGRALGRIEIRLFDHSAPYTTHNFRSFVVGHQGVSYVGSQFFWIDENGMIGGDFQRNDGSGGWSVYGSTFKDESFSILHDRPGLVTMANLGRKDTNGSQFIITTKPRLELDRRNIVFGEVVSGIDIIKHITTNYGSTTGSPRATVVIAAAGVWG